MENNNKDKQISQLREQLSRVTDLLEEERKTKKKSKNLDFVQVQRSELRAIADLGSKSALALELLMVLAQAMDKQNAVMISFKAMQDILNKSRPTLDRAIRLLKQENWIQVVKVGTANAYVLNSSVFWTGRSDQKMASFNAKVITTFKEQDKDVRENPDVSLKRIPLLSKSERISLTNEELPPPDQQDLDLN